MVSVSSGQAVVGLWSGPALPAVRAESSRGAASTGDTQPGHLGVCVPERPFLDQPANHSSVEADSPCLCSPRIFQRPLLLAFTQLWVQHQPGLAPGSRGLCHASLYIFKSHSVMGEQAECISVCQETLSLVLSQFRSGCGFIVPWSRVAGLLE